MVQPTSSARPFPFPADTQPQATYALLHELRGAHSKFFPTNNNIKSLARPDTTADDDTLQKKGDLADRLTLMRGVLGGWFDALAKEEGKNGAHATTTSTEAISMLSAAWDGPLQYLAEKPSALLFRPRSSDLSEPLPTALPAGTIQQSLSSLGSSDLITYLFPLVLRATASLEAALLSSPTPTNEDEEDVANLLWRERNDARVKLESGMIDIVGMLAECTLQVPWKGRDQVVQGGVGKAREVVGEMIRILRALLPSPNEPPPSYPLRLPLFEHSLARHRTTTDPFDSSSSSLILKSPLHARALFLSVLRILKSSIATSPYLTEFGPIALELLVKGWPATNSSLKGKEKADQVAERILRKSLEIATEMIEVKMSPFEDQTQEAVAFKVVEELKIRLGEFERGDRMDIDEDGERFDKEERRIEELLTSILSRLSRNDRATRSTSKLRQTVGTFVQEMGERLVQVVRDRTASDELRLAILFLLSVPIGPSSSSSDPSPSAQLLLHNPLQQFINYLSSSPPLKVPSTLSHLTLLTTKTAETLLQNLQQISQNGRKRKLDEVEEENAESGTQVARRKKGNWVESVDTVLKQVLEIDESFQNEGLENLMARLAASIPKSDLDEALLQLKVIGLLGCARDGLLSFPSSLDVPHPTCQHCDHWPSSLSSSAPPTPRIFTDGPLKGMVLIAKTILASENENEEAARRKLAFLRTLTRLLRHTKAVGAALEFGEKGLMNEICKGLESPDRPIRLATGNLVIAVVQGHQEKGTSTNFVEPLCAELDKRLKPSVRSAVLETTLIVVGRLAKVAEVQGFLEGRCLEKLVARVAIPNTLLKAIARTQLDEVADFKNTRMFALMQPHFATICPVLVSSSHGNPGNFKTAIECFQQAHDVMLNVTAQYTLPSLVLNNERELLEDIARASGKLLEELLVEANTGAAVFSYLFMRPSEVEQKRGINVMMTELRKNPAGSKITLSNVLTAIKVPLLFRLALELGDENQEVSKQAQKAMLATEKGCRGKSDHSDINIGDILKGSIVGILSFMNMALLESTAQRPMREKQKVIRGLAVITGLMGPKIAGFSPQIMATLHSSLDVPGLREATLDAFFTFTTKLKFSDIGPFVGTTSSTFVRLWPDFAPAERKIAAKTLNYILVEHSEHLKSFVHEVADLSGIPELVEANEKFQALKKTWSFDNRYTFILDRVESDNGLVAIQALKELKALMISTSTQLQTFMSGDSFDKSIGRIVKVLFGAAVRDGQENERIRNLAFECIGILGAVDPDRFELPPLDPPAVVLNNFEDREESVNFALGLIENLLIGAYRATNDTKHQAGLAFAIQELLRFCGFTADLLLSDSDALKPVDPAIRTRWAKLPKQVLETCQPLLGSALAFQGRRADDVEAIQYPIYSSTTSYRDWIRIWASDLISRLDGQAVKQIFGAFPPVLHLEDTVFAQHLLPHLVLTVILKTSGDDYGLIKTEIETVLQDQVNSTQKHLSANSRLLSARTVFDLMDHLSRYITQARKRDQELRSKRKSKNKSVEDRGSNYTALRQVEGILEDIPHVLVGHAALTCKAYARSLLNFESHIVAQKVDKPDSSLQDYYEKLHECYADLEEPDGMEGISTKILAPSVLHQIREHESTGRWTSAQSCWEVKLQQKADDPANHIGLLRCLRNLGHYDSMRTHIVGILQGRFGDESWDRRLAPYKIEASLIVGDWEAVEETLQIPDIEGSEVAFGKVITAMMAGDPGALAQAFFEARDRLGSPITAAGRDSYRRIYDSVVQLHILHELETINAIRLSSTKDLSTDFISDMMTRFHSTSPSFRAREPILNMRRTALLVLNSPTARTQIGELWLETSKIARKSGHSQTAYSAILQARDLNAPFAFLQSAKLLKSGGQAYKAIQELDNALSSLIPEAFTSNLSAPPSICHSTDFKLLAKSSLRRTRWMQEAGRMEEDVIALKLLESSRLCKDWETPYYHLGHYWDQRLIACEGKSKSQAMEQAALQYRLQTCKMFSEALRHGTKYIYQAMPRMLTIWLEMGDNKELLRTMKEATKGLAAPPQDDFFKIFNRINTHMLSNLAVLPPYQWITVLPQLVSRITHGNDKIFDVLQKILLKVIEKYPHQAFWAMASGAQSTVGRRQRRTKNTFNKARQIDGPSAFTNGTVTRLLDHGMSLVEQLLVLCNLDLQKSKMDPLSMKKTFPGLYKLTPLAIIIPLQSLLNVSLPADASKMTLHKPFPEQTVTFHKFLDEITIMSSLVRPRKISVMGDDGGIYSFLCKPKDDLRKDARLMEFNSMIIKLLKKDSDSRNRRLTIRTYSVVPLNEECGLIEWVPNVVVLRGVLNKLYAARNVTPWTPELRKTYETIRDVPAKTGARFEAEVQSKFVPVFHEWFLEMFPEPSAWLRARLSYSRTAAVISMVGFVLGLGDRHCENILLESTTGDTVHVDFNCLFDKGRSFEVAEQVPFRLTANIVDGMGVSGVEGVYRRAAEIALRILRDNQDSLMSVLETFLHDPLVEFNPNPKRSRAIDGEELKDYIAQEAKKHLEPVKNKLRGLQVTSDPASRGEKEVSVGEQVERLIREARNSKNLGSMYVGWAAWF